jgi:hypothetical protein
MPEHLSAAHREILVASLRMSCDFVCEWASAAALFALHAVITQQACHVAQRLDEQHSMSPAPQETLMTTPGGAVALGMSR